MAGFVDDAARGAFREAIETVERGSQAEIVVSVRRQSAAWTHTYVIVGIAAAVAMHAYGLFSSHPFSTAGLFAGPIVAGALAGLAATQVLAVPRLLTTAAQKRAAVRAAAEATFVERGMRRTRAATGVLVYVSLTEKMAHVIADDGVVACVDEKKWAELVDHIDGSVSQGAVATARAVQALGPVLARALPALAENVNELPDDLHGDAS